MTKLRLDRFFVALLVVISLFAGAIQAEGIKWPNVDPARFTHDRWYLDTVEGQPAGYWRSTLAVQNNKVITAYHEYSIELHGGERSTYEQRIVWTETKNYKPIHIVVTTSAGSDEVKKTYRFVNDGIELTSEQNGRTLTRKLPPIKGDYLTAAQACIATEVLMGNTVRPFEITILDLAASLTPYKVRYARPNGPPKPFVLADDSETNASLWTTTYSIFPGFEMKHWIDEDHAVVGLAYEIDGMSFASKLADAKVVDAKFDPPEMAGLSVVVPDKAIKDVHRKKQIVFELHYDTGESDIVPVATAQQSVKRLGNGKARVTVDLSAKPQAAEGDKPTDAHLASSIMVDHEDELVRKLAKQAIAKLKKDATAEQLAMACKRSVTRHINGNSLSVGDGSASEAARTREGDCTECAVLLAALLRANGIPSRCVNGLVYSEDDFAGQKDVFVYHMWTQAWIADDNGGGSWLDLDSAMWRYSAGHIALGVSAMGDGDQQDKVKIVPMQQDLQIKVIQTK